MRKEEIREIIQHMTSFYGDNLPINSSFETLVEVYMKVIVHFLTEIEYLQKHIAIETAPTLKRIPYMKLSVGEGIYDKREAMLILPLSFEERIAHLNDKGFYIQIHFDDTEVRTPIIYNMILRTEFTNDDTTLSLYDDYFLRDNRIYFSPEFILNLNRSLESIHAFDIRVDNFMLEKKWGTIFDIETGNFLPRFQYRDILSAYNRLMSSDLTIRDLKEAIHLSTKWEEFDIQDVKSPNIKPSIKRLYDEWYLSPAKFLVLLPEYLIQDKIRLNVIISLLHEVKEEQVDFLILFLIFREEFFEYGDRNRIGYKKWQTDKLVNEEKTRFIQKFRATDYFTLPHNYDVGRHYDYLLKYDYEQEPNEVFGMDGDEDVALIDTKNSVLDTPWMFQADHFTVRHIQFPKIPRNVAFEKNGDDVVFTFDESKDGTLLYELYGAAEEQGEYVKLGEVSASENETNSIIHNASSGDIRYYKLRANAKKEYSLFTLAHDIEGNENP